MNSFEKEAHDEKNDEKKDEKNEPLEIPLDNFNGEEKKEEKLASPDFGNEQPKVKKIIKFDYEPLAIIQRF